MAISMVRKPSETPNINNISDIIPFRYAYGGQNGYVKGKGRELDYTAIGTQFTIGSGRVVLDGVESDIDGDGIIINIDSVSETRYYVVYYNVNLATNTTTIMSQYATGSYPTIEKGDDLTESPEGSANLVLYKFTATSGIISNVEKVVKEIMYSMADYDNSKGTIEERLNNLGFRQSTIQMTDEYGALTTNSQCICKRQGNYVILELVFEGYGHMADTLLQFARNNSLVCTLPEEFRPKSGVRSGMKVTGYSTTQIGTISYSGFKPISIELSGEIYAGYLSPFPSTVTNIDNHIWIGYEANPL